MATNDQRLILSRKADIWDGSHQMPGRLELWEKEIIFRLCHFKSSHLHLSIPLNAIEKVEEYLIFDLAKNGLRIQNKNGKYDLFVLDDGQHFKKILLRQLK